MWVEFQLECYLISTLYYLVEKAKEAYLIKNTLEA